MELFHHHHSSDLLYHLFFYIPRSDSRSLKQKIFCLPPTKTNVLSHSPQHRMTSSLLITNLFFLIHAIKECLVVNKRLWW